MAQGVTTRVRARIGTARRAIAIERRRLCRRLARVEQCSQDQHRQEARGHAGPPTSSASRSEHESPSKNLRPVSATLSESRWPRQARIAKQGWEVDDGESWIALWALPLPARGVSGGLRQEWGIALDVGPGRARHQRADDSGIPTG